MFRSIQRHLIILKTDDEQFTLTTNKIIAYHVIMSKISKFSSWSYNQIGDAGLLVGDSNMMFLGWDVTTGALPSQYHIWMLHLQAWIFSECELLLYMLSPIRVSVCLSSVTLVHPTQPVEIFSNVCHLVPWPSIDIHGKFYENCPRGDPLSGALNARGVAKYSDFAPIEGYISEMVQDRR